MQAVLSGTWRVVEKYAALASSTDMPVHRRACEAVAPAQPVAQNAVAQCLECPGGSGTVSQLSVLRGQRNGMQAHGQAAGQPSEPMLQGAVRGEVADRAETRAVLQHPQRPQGRAAAKAQVGCFQIPDTRSSPQLCQRPQEGTAGGRGRTGSGSQHEPKTGRAVTTPRARSPHLSWPPALSLAGSLAGELVVEGGQRDREGRQRRERPLDVHREAVLVRASELQQHRLVVLGRDELEVLDGGHGHAAVEVEDVRADLRNGGNRTRGSAGVGHV